MSAVLEVDVCAAQQRDSLAFTRLVDASKNVVASIAFAIVRDPATSEEVAQDVYLEAWNGLGSLRNPSSFLPWLRQLTRNRSHECLRSRSRYRRRHASWTADAEEVADAVANASERYVEAETAAALADALEELPEDARDAHRRHEEDRAPRLHVRSSDPVTNPTSATASNTVRRDGTTW